MDVLKAIFDFANNFLSAPLGQSILLVAIVAVAGYFWRQRSQDLLTIKTLEIGEARSKREDDLEKARLDNEEKEDQRRAIVATENVALMREMKTLQSQMAAILGRFEPKLNEAVELLQTTKDNTDAIAARTGVINKNVLAVGNKVDAVQADSRARTTTLTNQMNQNDQQTWGMLNSRTQKVEGAVTDLGHRLETKQNERHTQQMELMDQVLKELVSVGNKIVNLQKDNAAAPKVVDDAQLTKVLGLLGEIFEIVKPKKKPTGPLDPNVIAAVPETLARPTVAENVPLVSEAVGLTPKRNTDKLPDPPPPTIIPAAPVDISRPITGTFATPTTTGNEETQKLDFSKLTEGRHDAQ